MFKPLLVVLIFFLIYPVHAQSWTIEENKVYFNDSKIYISAEPHTTPATGYVYFNITPKEYAGKADIAFGFNGSNGLIPQSADLLQLNGTWKPIVSLFEKHSYNYDSFDTWYLGKNLPVQAGRNYTLRVWLRFPMDNMTGKYGIALKPSVQTIQQAITNGNFYYLDPWYGYQPSITSAFYLDNNIVSTNVGPLPNYADVYSISAKLTQQPGPGTFKIKTAIYYNFNRTFIAASEEKKISLPIWPSTTIYTFNFTPTVKLKPIHSYMLAVWTNDTAATTAYLCYGPAPVTLIAYDNEVYTGTFPNPLVDSGYRDNYSYVYANYNYWLTPITPANGSTVSSTFPPLTTDVTFTWSNTTSPYYRILISEDPNFHNIVIDDIVSTPTTTASLQYRTYYWKVAEYNGTTGTYTDPFNFEITASTPGGSTAIHGVVYEIIDGTPTALNAAQVIASNGSHTFSALTGANGYYLFDNLKDNSTYTVTATKEEYDPSIINYVTPALNTWSMQNILLNPKVEDVFRHYVKFAVQNIWGTTKYKNVDVTVYKYGDYTAYRTGATGNDGSATFQLYKNQRYTITFINATQGISITRNLYPWDENYIVIVPSTPATYQQHTVPISSGISTTVTKKEINATAAYLNVTYLDSLNQTTALTVYVNQTAPGDPANQSIITSWSAGAVSNTTHSFIISNYAGQSYLVKFNIVHGTYGTVKKTYGVQFKNPVSFTGVPQSAWLYFAIAIMLFTAGMFAYSNVPMGMIILGMEGVLFDTFAWFDTLPGNNADAILNGSVVVIVFGILTYLSRSANKEGYN